MFATGVKSLLGCQGSFESNGSVACELVVARSVVPSGSDRINSLTASAPPAPGLDSISTGWPICSLSFCPTMRATTSTPPPGANGTRSLIGRVGSLLCAQAASHAPDTAPSNSAANSKRGASPFRGIVPSRIFDAEFALAEVYRHHLRIGMRRV